MKRLDPKVYKLLKRALKTGISLWDYQKFIILSSRGYEPGIYTSLESSIALKELRASIRTNPFDIPPYMAGDIILGRGPKGINRYYSRYAPTHLLGVGATGSGKTVYLIFVLLQYLLITKGIWIFDFVKRRLRGFRRLAQRVGREVIVCRHEMLRINLLDPQGNDPAQYVNICSEFITINLNLPPVSRHILKISITHLYAKFGLFINPNAEPPTLSELIEEVKRFGGSRAAKDAILVRLNALLSNQKQVFNVRRGLPVRKLSNLFIIWELDGLEMQYQNLIVTYLLSMLFLHRVNNPSDELIIVALDEAIRLYSKAAESSIEEPSFISTMTSVVREMSIALFVMTQSCYDLSNSIIANSGIKILFRAGTAVDYDIFGRAMGLTSKETYYCKTNLSEGKQIIKLGFGWQKPFLNKSPMVRIPQDVSDAEVRQSCEKLLKLIPQPPRIIPCLPEHVVTDEFTKPLDNLSDDERVLYQEILNNPYEPSTTVRYRNIGLTTKRGNTAKKSLVDKGIIKETPVETGKRGGKQLFLEVIDFSSGRVGNALHKYLRDRAGNWYLRQGCTVETEKLFVIDGQRFYTDLAITCPNGLTEAAEVETEDSQRVTGNIQKNLRIGFSSVLVLTPNSKVRTTVKIRVKNEFDSALLEKIRFPRMCFYK